MIPNYTLAPPRFISPDISYNPVIVSRPTLLSTLLRDYPGFPNAPVTIDWAACRNVMV